eukprot:8497368-Lingulodinium_polyedra.AAC.1
MAADRLWPPAPASPRTVRLADDRLRRVYPGCYLREHRIVGYIEFGGCQVGFCLALCQLQLGAVEMARPT